ncbi:MAG: HAMP domain-containing histidine kinase [Thermomicrobiales bacterium]|nr:HAMP domain-containing histidine kinase [Thermomicrobiales bacterium]
MSRLVNDLLFLARVDAQRVGVVMEPCDLAAVVRGAVEPMQALASAAGVRLTLETPQPVPIIGDADQLRSVVRNLVDNAIRCTPAGGSVVAWVRMEAGRPTVRIVDTGVGMDQTEADRVFDRFYRPDGARSRGSGGAGLGLAIARAIVVAHDGKIGLRSALGQGAEVWFSLPPTAVPAARGSRAARRLGQTTPPAGSSPELPAPPG